MFFLALLSCVAGLAHVPWLSTHIVESRTETLVWISSAILEVGLFSPRPFTWLDGWLCPLCRWDALAGLLALGWACAQALGAPFQRSPLPGADWTTTRGLGFPRVVCSFRYLVFQLRVNARLPVIYVGMGEADSSASLCSSRYRPSVIPTVFSLLLSPAFPHTSGPEPRAISCSRPDWLSWFLPAFQQAFWLPAPLGCLVEYFGPWLSLPLSSINTIQPAFLILEISYISHPLVNPVHPLSFDIRVSLFLCLPSWSVILHAISSKHKSSISWDLDNLKSVKTSWTDSPDVNFIYHLNIYLHCSSSWMRCLSIA